MGAQIVVEWGSDMHWILRWFVACMAGVAIVTLAGLAPATAQRGDNGHVYLMRGLLNVFSLGMDDLAEKIRARGISASVYNHGAWESLAEEAAAKYRERKIPIVIVGHSLGADAVFAMAQRLHEMKVPVRLAVAFDPTVRGAASANVARFVNLYQSSNAVGGGTAYPGPGFRGSLSNVDLHNQADIGHVSIDKSPRLHSQVIGMIAQAIGRGAPPATVRRPAAANEAQRKQDPTDVAPAAGISETKAPNAAPDRASAN